MLYHQTETDHIINAFDHDRCGDFDHVTGVYTDHVTGIEIETDHVSGV